MSRQSRNLAGDDYTYPFTDLVPLSAGEWALDDDLRSTLGWIPRGMRANADGDLVYRLTESGADRTITVSAGEIVIAFFATIKTGTTCEPAVGK